MTDDMKTQNKRLTQNHDDAAYLRLASKVREEYRSKRAVEMNEPSAVLEKIEQLERILLAHMATSVGETQWVFQGFDIKPSPDAFALWPITAKLLFIHTKYVGYKSTQSWEGSGGLHAFEWLNSIGFPVADVELIMN